MKHALLIFPHQLYYDHPAFTQQLDLIVMIEDRLFYGDDQYPCNFHKQKLILHRASMRCHYDRLIKRKMNVEYIEYASAHWDNIAQILDGFDIITYYDVVDFTLEKRIRKYLSASKLEVLDSPNFLNTNADNRAFRKGKKRWFMADFYQYQRKRLNLLIEDGGPVGGQWSFDEDNRKKLPKEMIDDLPKLPSPTDNEYVRDAKKYVRQQFPEALGDDENFLYPIDHSGAKDWLSDFLEHRFANFGPYEDAIVEDQNYLYHSLLTPMLNIGLLDPKMIIDTAIKYADQHDVPLLSLEGFVRQIIGWREFMRASYVDLGVSMRTTNHWQHKQAMPAAFYDGSTGILPIDNCIKRILETGYCHHIERLMLLGGFMFLCEINPDEIYKWFMELFIDSYDWVMVPNVYAMSQHADGGQITTKPYFSGSNYVRKMSHYVKGDWCDSWDGLYWSWILQQADDLRKNPRWAMMVRMAENMGDDKKDHHQKQAKQFLEGLHGKTY